jgi:hypothetical protein
LENNAKFVLKLASHCLPCFHELYVHISARTKQYEHPNNKYLQLKPTIHAKYLAG